MTSLKVNEFNIDEITCPSTVKLCAAASLDSLCCMTCCNFCGGCCGRVRPFTMKAMNENADPGMDLFLTNCYMQCIAGILMPFSLCGCFWACCGTCTPCVKGVYKCVISVEENNGKQLAVVPPIKNEMTR